MVKVAVNIVWFKRDLRLHDHAPLLQAIDSNRIIPLYIVEPGYWALPDTSYRQYQFTRGCLDELNQLLTNIGAPLMVQVGAAVPVFQMLVEHYAVQGVYSHMETGNLWTYRRDQDVSNYLKNMGIPWYESRQFGVQRGVFDRGHTGDPWAQQWDAWAQQPLLPAPQQAHGVPHSGHPPPLPEDLGLLPDGILYPQDPSRKSGLALLESFLHQRGEHYQRHMSSPLTAPQECSRLSPYLTYGCLSLREVYQAALARQRKIWQLPSGLRGHWPGALRAFISRLHWHCHFIQKLEGDPHFEHAHMNPAYDALDRHHDPNRLRAWQTGHTGYPYVDACMRWLIATGWANFRVRAMLMSFASYHLWLDWRATTPYLAGLFTDYEPGIHYSQVQMQSGTTGINQTRVYNPIKQGQDFDPQAQFIRAWVPELAPLPAEFCHEPWLLPPALHLTYGFTPGVHYPLPIIDEPTARRHATDKIYAIRNSYAGRTAAQALFQKHGSRKRQARTSAQPMGATQVGARKAPANSPAPQKNPPDKPQTTQHTTQLGWDF